MEVKKKFYYEPSLKRGSNIANRAKVANLTLSFRPHSSPSIQHTVVPKDISVSIDLNYLNSLHLDLSGCNFLESKKYKILIRKCYVDIYNGIIENICRSRTQPKKYKNIFGSSITFIPQCNFLIYGNRGIGKTSLCYYLSYMFKEDLRFKDYDIIIFSRMDQFRNSQRCYVRYSDECNLYKEENDIPTKRHGSIIISDNVEIKEDEFSEDDIIIMISSLSGKKCKTFRDKRQPIQYNIPQMNDENELRTVLKLIFGNDELYNLALEFGGNILNLNRYKAKGGLERMLQEIEVNEIYNSIPEKYDEDIFIYDTEYFDDIPRRLRFISTKIEEYFNMKCKRIKVNYSTEEYDFSYYLGNETKINSSNNSNEKQKYNIVELKKAEEKRISSKEKNVVDVEKILSIAFIPCNITEKIGNRKKIDGIKYIFDNDNLPEAIEGRDEKGRYLGLMKINYRIFQYPMDIIYIRESYINLYKYIMSYYLPNSSSYFLLRGSGGIGKTSFAISFLYMLQQNMKKEYIIDKSTKIVFIKNTNNSMVIYQLTVDGLETIDGVPRNANILISDSYNYNINNHHIKGLYIIISSLDEKYYSNFLEYKGCVERHYLFLDVFDDNEINNWIEYCLPDVLAEYINKHKLAKRYGNVPSHIYFASVYGYYYERNYWEEIYTKGIDIALCNLGFVQFVKKYLLPCDNDSGTISKSKVNMFDNTMCHYIIKYAVEANTDPEGSSGVENKLVKISDSQMGFISDDVVDYLVDSVHHLTKIDEIETILVLFNNHVKRDKNLSLYQFLFHELVWCKCSTFIGTLQRDLLKTTPERVRIGTKSGIFPIDEVKFINKFKNRFKRAIYSTSIDEIYIVFLGTLRNGDRLYLVNNCFIHSSIYYTEELLLDEDVDVFINKIKNYLQEELGFSLFYFISIYPTPTASKTPISKYMRKAKLNVINFYKSLLNCNDFYRDFSLQENKVTIKRKEDPKLEVKKRLKIKKK